MKSASFFAIAFAVVCGCSSSSSPTTTDSGTGPATDTGTGGGGCSGTYSGAVSGTIACDPPLLVNKDLALGGTLSGDVSTSVGISLKATDNLVAKTYAMKDLKQVDTQVVGAGKTWGLHFDSTNTDPPDPKWAASMTITSLDPPHGTVDLTLAEEGGSSTLTEHLTF